MTTPGDDQRIGVVIVNWNRDVLTIRCLASLKSARQPPRDIVVVDNASAPGSAERVRTAAPGVEVLENERNLGFSGGYNVGIKRMLAAGVGHVLLLNDDAVVDTGCLAALADAAARHPRAVLGCKVLMLEAQDVILSTGGRLSRCGRLSHRGLGETDIGQYDEEDEVDWLSGCALMVCRDTVRRIGLLDERLFAYFEDVEWCVRARRAGVAVRFVPSARVWHPDTRRRDSESAVRTYYMARNHLRVLRMHGFGTRALGTTLATQGRTLVSWSVKPRWRAKGPQRDALARALWDFARGRGGPAPESIAG